MHGAQEIYIPNLCAESEILGSWVQPLVSASSQSPTVRFLATFLSPTASKQASDLGGLLDRMGKRLHCTINNLTRPLVTLINEFILFHLMTELNQRIYR